MQETKPEMKTDYMEDSQGRMIPRAQIKEIDLVRNELVIEIMLKAMAMSEALAKFKGAVMGDIEAFIQLSAEKYGAHLGGKRGNVVLYSFDGRYKIQRSIDDYIVFDERLQAAKSLIDECLKRWSQGSQPQLHAIVNDAFQVDKTGRINTNRILSLRRIEIDDEIWQKAMKAIGESIQVMSTKSYIRFYERQSDGSYKQLNLNIAA